MNKELEIEAKYLLSETSFLLLLDHFKIDKSAFFLQKNHYFDTKDLVLLTKLDMMLRVREKNNCFELTLKLPHQDHILEMNYPLSSFDYTNHALTQFPEIRQILEQKKVALSAIKFQATLATMRATIPYLGGELFFDISTYDGISDYEIEYEVNTSIDEAHEKLASLLHLLEIEDYQPSCPKAKRCLQKKC